MRIKELQRIISSATNVTVFVAKTKKDADNEVAVYTYHIDVYSDITGMENWPVEYIYPRAKDELEAWCVKSEIR